ncbi:unnamed protein product [Penicillium camemberti]|uniref:Str. FM013 n=1 Tax=Penicillium camemberti (strain FM 013) TaxID=1429867 RepID=A0A0G4PRK0_PENC3|nr:unnamed protein product [Penicillium camemberti]
MPKDNKDIEDLILKAIDSLSKQSTPEYYIRRRRDLNVEKASALDKTMVERWFQDYQRVVTKHGICQQDIYNFDETGFQIGVRQDQFIITREPKRSYSIDLSQNTEFSTPKTAKRIRRISSRLSQYDPTIQRFKDGLEKLIKGAKAQAVLALQLQREFDRTQAIIGARHARYNNYRRHIQITGIISST